MKFLVIDYSQSWKADNFFYLLPTILQTFHLLKKFVYLIFNFKYDKTNNHRADFKGYQSTA